MPGDAYLPRPHSTTAATISSMTLATNGIRPNLRMVVPLGVLFATDASDVLARPPADGPMLVETAEGRRLMEIGRAHLHAMRLEAADSAFVRLDALEPASPAGAYHRATSA